MKSHSTLALAPGAPRNDIFLWAAAAGLTFSWLALIGGVAAHVYGQHGFIAAGAAVAGIHVVLATGFVILSYVTLAEPSKDHQRATASPLTA